MGQVISASASADDIFADIETTYVRATARGGVWQTLATQRLGNVREVIGNVQSRLSTAQAEAAPLAATVAAQDQHADRLIGQVADTIWNAIDRPAFDPTYDVVFPGGIAHYTDGTNEGQPDRMALLGDLLEMNMITKLDPTLLASLVQQVRSETDAYRKVVEAAAKPMARVQQLQRARTAVAHAARMELGHLKRLYKAEGFSEADIHTVIPDRPRATKKPEATPTASADKTQN